MTPQNHLRWSSTDPKRPQKTSTDPKSNRSLQPPAPASVRKLRPTFLSCVEGPWCPRSQTTPNSSGGRPARGDSGPTTASRVQGYFTFARRARRGPAGSIVDCGSHYISVERRQRSSLLHKVHVAFRGAWPRGPRVARLPCAPRFSLGSSALTFVGSCAVLAP